jgi:hypothetical protein
VSPFQAALPGKPAQLSPQPAAVPSVVERRSLSFKRLSSGLVPSWNAKRASHRNMTAPVSVSSGASVSASTRRPRSVTRRCPAPEIRTLAKLHSRKVDYRSTEKAGADAGTQSKNSRQRIVHAEALLAHACLRSPNMKCLISTQATRNRKDFTVPRYSAPRSYLLHPSGTLCCSQTSSDKGR